MMRALKIIATAGLLLAVLGIASCRTSSQSVPPAQTGPPPVQTTAEHDWQTYTNVRFAYSLCYPDDLLAAQGESENGDGQKFLSKDGKAQLLAYGSYNVLDQRLDDLYTADTKSAEAEGLRVSYKLRKPDFFVFSGSGSGKVRYQKTALVGDTFKTFRLDYPEAAKADYDPVAEKMSVCFHTKLKTNAQN
jgi:hypothetical protein